MASSPAPAEPTGEPSALPESVQLVAAPGEDLDLLDYAERYLHAR